MRICHKLCLIVAIVAPATSPGQTKCPWLNEPTAGEILGGGVTATTKIHGHEGGVCEFSRLQGTTVHQLTISVELMTNIPKEFPTYLEKCPPKSAAIRAIGNEAVGCSIERSGNEYAERVVGRVRDQAFVVTLSTSAKNDLSLTQSIRREKANLVAEQVAGIIF
jgi:hypothetical protein